MKSWHFFLTVAIFLVLFRTGLSQPQMCGNWNAPFPISDSVADNTHPFISGNYYEFYIFWERMTDDSVSQIIWMDYYDPGVPETLISADGYTVSNPRAIHTADWWPYSDTSAFVFYQSDQAGNADIYYKMMFNDGGFSEPVPFAVGTMEEVNLNVGQGGGMVWQAGDKICFTRLNKDPSGFSFEPVITIDSGQCRKPAIGSTSDFMVEDYIVWEKGDPYAPEIWYSQWGWGSGQWSLPIPLFEDGRHFDPEISANMYWLPLPQLVSDYLDDSGQYHFSVYDLYAQEEYISDMSQSISLQPSLFSMDIPTTEFWASGFMSFRYGDNSVDTDIFCNDYGEFMPWIDNYCCIDSNEYPERNPQLHQGREGGDCFDLILVWEAFKNGHWQIYTSTTLVVIGEIEEKSGPQPLQLEVFPNPCQDVIRIGCMLDETSDGCIRVMDNIGKILIIKELNNLQPGWHSEMIPVSSLPAGTYHIQLSANSSTGTAMMIKH